MNNKPLAMTCAAAMIGFAATVNAEEINLRDWLTSKGATVADCVSGTDYANDTYGPKNLFDGVKESTVSSARWLAGRTSAETASVTIEIPESALLFANKKLVLKRIRLWRNLDGSGVQRAPTTWVVSGSNNGTDWFELQRQSAAVTWNDSTKSFEVALPDNSGQYRFMKFQPLTSATDYEWRVGLQEIEYFMEEVPQKDVNLREWLTGKGVTVADCVSGEGHASGYGPTILFDGVNTVETYDAARANRWLVNEQYGTTTAYATMAAPNALFDAEMGGLVLKRYRVYKYSSLSNDSMDDDRAPVSWVIYGSNDGVTWDVVHDQSEVAEWRDPGKRFLDYVEYEVPESGRIAYRQFKFRPTQSLAGAYASGPIASTWQEGMMELELFVEESAPVVNLRDYLTEKGVTPTDCVTGTGYANNYGPERLFDGAGMDGVQNASARWLAGENSAANASVTIEIPSSALPSGKKGLALKKIRLWRNINVYGNDGVERAPTTWVFYVSNDGTNWTELQSQSEAVTWSSAVISHDVVLADNETLCRYIKFQPLSSIYVGGWKVGLHELEYFVSEVAYETVVVRGSLGDGVGDVSCGYGRVDGVSVGDTLTIAAESPSCADGVKYEATGYTLETSTDGGITWGAATSHSGTSATIAYDGTPTRITWQWSPIAYRLNAHADEGNETVTVSPASSDGYYAAGTALSVTAAGATSPTVTTFAEWDVLPDGAVANGATVSFTMPAAPTEVNARFTRPWTFVLQEENFAGYPDYELWSAVTDGNWLFTVSSRENDAVSADKYLNIYAYVEGSGQLDMTRLYSDLATEGKIPYPMRGIRESAMYATRDGNNSWKNGRSKVTSVVVPADIWDVEGDAFSACPNLASVTLGGTLEKWNVISGGTAGAFRDCPALTNAVVTEATTLPHHLFAGSAPEVLFRGLPPTTVVDSWADNWSLAVGCHRSNLASWKSDSRFTPLASIENVATKPNYAEMSAKYGQELVGAWNGKWLVRYGDHLAMVISIR